MNIRQTVYRPTPKGPPGLYTTFRIAAPPATHFRPATCAEVECVAFNNGWTYVKADLERENLLYVVTHAGKRYREMVLPKPVVDAEGETQFVDELCLVFEPGQVCFQARSHKLPVGRPEFYFAGRGDHRAFSVRNAQQFKRADDWVDMFSAHQDRVQTLIQRG